MIRARVRRALASEPSRADGTMSERQHHAVFLRGLSLGALVGAAIAGSAIWDRRRARRGRADGADGSDGSAAASKGNDAGNA